MLNVFTIAVASHLVDIYSKVNVKIWFKQLQNDTVNKTAFKAIFNSQVNLINRTKYMKELLAVASMWMQDIFGEPLKLVDMFIQIYTPLTNSGEEKVNRSLRHHVDGGEKTGDLVAVVYTIHGGL